MVGDYISRAAAIKSTWMILEGMGYQRSENRSLERTVEAVFESAPAADVVEVVRCRECKYRAEDDFCIGRAILIILCLDHILIALGLIAWLIFRKEK